MEREGGEENPRVEEGPTPADGEGRPPQERHWHRVRPVRPLCVRRLPEPNRLGEPRLPSHPRSHGTVPVLARGGGSRLYLAIRILPGKDSAGSQSDRTS